MTRVFVSTVSSVSIFLILLSLAWPGVTTRSTIHTLYIGYSLDHADQPAASITRIAQTSHIGIKPPFVPVCVVETQQVERVVESALPIGGVTLGSWTRDERAVIVRLIDGEDRDGELRYWHFPTKNDRNTKDPFIEGIERQISDLDLPDNMDQSFTDGLNELYGIGDPVEASRRDEMISLAVDALRASEFAWAGELMATRQASVVNRTSTGFSRVIVYSAFCLLVALSVGILTWIRIGNHSEKIPR